MAPATTGIVDVGAANRASIAQALERAGASPVFVDTAAALDRVEAVVFPGVAHFGFVAEAVDRFGLRDTLVGMLSRGVPFLGICVGFQMLFEGSEEAPGARGLGIFRGRAERLAGPHAPHMGWNTVDARTGREDLAGWAYFAHDFAPPFCDGTAATTTYGRAFTSVVERGAIAGVQFHPERSGTYGSALLARFVSGIGVVGAR